MSSDIIYPTGNIRDDIKGDMKNVVA
jgi:hypothetical protein